MIVQAEVITKDLRDVVVDPQKVTEGIYEAWLRSIHLPTDCYVGADGNWHSHHDRMFPRERGSRAATDDEIKIAQAHTEWSRMIYHLVRNNPTAFKK